MARATLHSAVAGKKEDTYRKFFSEDVVTLILCGFLVGVALTVLWHILYSSCTLQDISKWVIYVSGVLVVLVLCFSHGVRCTITLAIPIMCSSKGRSLLVAFAFVLAATGPTLNIIRNVDVLTSSLSCGQAKLRESLEQMLEVMKQPLVAVKKAIMTVLCELRSVMKKVEKMLFKIKELVMVILAGIKNAFDWLANVVNVCNKEFGTPFDRCMRVADSAMESCREKLGVLSGICHATHIFSMLCYSLKFFDVICVMVVFFNDAILGIIAEKMRIFTQEIKQMFDVSVTFDHDFTFETIASKDLSAVGAEIIQDLHSRMNSFFVIFGWLEIISCFLFLTVVLKALYFKMKYLRNPGFNNQYLTKEFFEIDEKRQQTKQELALPLTKSEQNKYVPLAGCRLTRLEMLKMTRSMIFLVISCVQVFSICFADYSLYWVLAMITYYGHQEGEIEVPPFITVDVKGGGFVGQIFKGIAHAFEPLSQTTSVDSTPCLPVPKVPNMKQYLNIGGLCLLAWIFLVCEPYGLRLRHVVMRVYYPEVARERATWLYNKILMKRMSFFKLMRRKARAKFRNDRNVDDFTILDWLRAKTEGRWLCRKVLGRRKADSCIICSSPVHNDKVACETQGCKAIYCQSCYAEGNNTCCVCKSPIEYGDLSDLSDVTDSSDDPDAVLCM